MSVGEVDDTDALLPCGQWPGVRLAYGLSRLDPDGDPALELTATFSAGRLSGAGAAIDAALATFARVTDQLLDPHTVLELGTTLAASQPARPDECAVIAETDQLRGPMQVLVAAASRQLHALAADGGAAVAPVLAQCISASLPLPALATRGQDVFPVAVNLTVRRDGKVVPDVSLIRATGTAMSTVEPNLVGGDAGALARFASRCEAALADYDGAGSVLKLAVSVPADGPATTPELWAVRWGKTAGMIVDFPNVKGESGSESSGAPGYFVALPLSNSPLSGTVDLQLYDGDLRRQDHTRTYLNISVATWAADFLHSMDELVGLDWIASVSPSSHAELAVHRTRLAAAIVAGIAPLSLDQSLSPDQLPPLIDSLADARHWVQRALLGGPAVAADIAAVVTVPMTITTTGQSQSALRVRGLVEVVNSSPHEPGTAETVVSEAELSLVAGEDGWLSFALSAPAPVGDIDLPVRYRISHLEHRVDRVTSWLEMLVAGPGSAFDIDLGMVGTELPSPVLPDQPTLCDHGPVAGPVQQADSSVAEPLAAEPLGAEPLDVVADALRWNYAARVQTTTDPRDQLWIRTSYGMASDDWSEASLERAAGTDAERAAGLFTSLARFRFAYESLGPAFATLSAADARSSSPATIAAIEAVAGLVGAVAKAWSAVAGQPEPGSAYRAPALAAPDVVPFGSYVLSFAEPGTADHVAADDGGGGDTLRIFGLGSATVPPNFPRLSLGAAGLAMSPTAVGMAGSDAPDATRAGVWWQAGYAGGAERSFLPDAVELTFTWDHLELLAAPSATAAFRLVRNAELARPEFVLNSATVAFRTRAAPAVVISPIGPLPWRGSVFDSVWPVFEAIGASASDRALLLNVAVDYEWELVAFPGAFPITTRLPVLLVRPFPLPGGDAGAMRGFATSLASQISEWQAAHPELSDSPGWLSLQLGVSGTVERHPLVSFEQISVLAR